jgi:DNA-directed RNA polymerase sigma subunit (sigma70/sigma32)
MNRKPIVVLTDRDREVLTDQEREVLERLLGLNGYLPRSPREVGRAMGLSASRV